MPRRTSPGSAARARRSSAATLAGRLPPAASQDLVEWGSYGESEAEFAAILSTEMPMAEIQEAERSHQDRRIPPHSGPVDAP